MIRTAKLSDVHQIATVQVESWKSAYRDTLPKDYLKALSTQTREDYWSQSIMNGSPELLVAEKNSTITGWIAFGPSRDSDASKTTGEIEAIYVQPECWSVGTGQALWSHAMPRLVVQGFETVTLWVLAENERAIKFYRKTGFAPEPESVKTLEIAGKKLEEIRFTINIS